MEYNNSVSIIMPVLNEEKYIEKCLNSITSQSYKNIFEIMVLDGMSTDRTREIVSELRSRDKRIKLIDNPQKIQSEAMNMGIKLATGDIIIRVDAHALYEDKYVENCVLKLNCLNSSNVVNVGGPTYLIESGNYVENSIVYLHESKFGIGVAKFRQKDYEGFVDTVWNGAFWKWVFGEVGLYNVKLYRSEDNDMNNRITKRGYRIYQSKDIISYYRPRTSIKKVLKQNFENGVAIGTALIDNKSIVRIRHLVPVCFLVSIVLFGASWSSIFFSKYIESFILISYFLLDILESLKIGKVHGIKYIPMMFVLFFLLHIYYGAGTIHGFARRLVKRENSLEV
jgi:succinoglycan biosynthesis protein ExoA